MGDGNGYERLYNTWDRAKVMNKQILNFLDVLTLYTNLGQELPSEYSVLPDQLCNG